MRWTFIDPDGQEHQQLPLEEIMDLIRNAGSEYWHSSSATAGVTSSFASGARSEIVILVEPGVGPLLQFCEPGGANEYIFVEGDSTQPVTVYPGGNEWIVPRRYFLSHERAEAVLGEFIATGLKPTSECVLVGNE